MQPHQKRRFLRAPVLDFFAKFSADGIVLRKEAVEQGSVAEVQIAENWEMVSNKKSVQGLIFQAEYRIL